MRLGLIARADSRGLGVQTKAVFDHLHPVKTMVVDCPSAKPLPLRMDWFPGATWVHGLPTHADFRHWLQGLDVVYTAETAYGSALWDEAERAGVKTVLHANYEFLNRNDRPTLWLAPSLWHFDDFPAPKRHLPVPVEYADHRLTANETCTQFVHVIGRPAVVPTLQGQVERNGTADLLKALQYVTSQVTVTVRCQEPGFVNSLVAEHNIRTPNNVTFRIESGDVKDNADLYKGQDVLVLPRRWGGLCLPCNEALAAGLPVIMPNISPNDAWLPDEWLTPASLKTAFKAKCRVDVYETRPQVLAAKMDRFAQDRVFFAEAQRQARKLADELSWDSLHDTYAKTFEELM